MMDNTPPPAQVAERVSMLWWTVFGVDGRNGLRGTQAQLVKRVERLESYHERLDTIWRLVKWLGLGVATTLGAILSGPIGELVGRTFLGGR